MSDRFKDSKWLASTENPSIVDIHIFPILERVVLLEGTPMNDFFDRLDVKNKLPTIYEYVNRFREIPEFKDRGIVKKEAYIKYWNDFFALPDGERPVLQVSYLE